MAALVDRRRPDATIENPKVVEVDVGIFAGLSAKFALRSPAAAGEIFGARSEVHAAIDRPEDGVSQDGALDRGRSDIGDEKPGLARHALHRMRGEGKIKNRNAFNAERAAVDAGVSARPPPQFCAH